MLAPTDCLRIRSPFPLDRTSQAEPGEPSHTVERRGAFASSSGELRGLPAFPLVDEWAFASMVGGSSLASGVGAALRGAGPGADSPRSMRCRSAVASPSWPARVSRVASRMRFDSASFHLILSARAALTAGVACKAPSTETEAMVARTNSGVTSWAMVAKPRTLMCSISPARCAASRSSRL